MNHTKNNREHHKCILRLDDAINKYEQINQIKRLCDLRTSVVDVGKIAEHIKRDKKLQPVEIQDIEAKRISDQRHNDKNDEIEEQMLSAIHYLMTTIL